MDGGRSPLIDGINVVMVLRIVRALRHFSNKEQNIWPSQREKRDYLLRSTKDVAFYAVVSMQFGKDIWRTEASLII